MSHVILHTARSSGKTMAAQAARPFNARREEDIAALVGRIKDGSIYIPNNPTFAELATTPMKPLTQAEALRNLRRFKRQPAPNLNRDLFDEMLDRLYAVPSKSPTTITS